MLRVKLVLTALGLTMKSVATAQVTPTLPSTIPGSIRLDHSTPTASFRGLTRDQERFFDLAALSLSERTPIVRGAAELELRANLASILKRIKECPSCAEVLNPYSPNSAPVVLGSAPTLPAPLKNQGAGGMISQLSPLAHRCPENTRFYYHAEMKCVSAEQALRIETKSSSNRY